MCSISIFVKKNINENSTDKWKPKQGSVWMVFHFVRKTKTVYSRWNGNGIVLGNQVIDRTL